jgi:transposase
MLDDEISFESSGGGEPPVRRLEVLSGPGGRRRWTAEAKGRVIEETLRPGANIAEIARRHGLMPQQLYGWRSAARARETASGAVFVPMEVDDDAGMVEATKGSVVVVQAGGMVIHVPAGVRADHIERVLLAVRMSA